MVMVASFFWSAASSASRFHLVAENFKQRQDERRNLEKGIRSERRFKSYFGI
jgi:hypothetical protein